MLNQWSMMHIAQKASIESIADWDNLNVTIINWCKVERHNDGTDESLTTFKPSVTSSQAGGQGIDHVNYSPWEWSSDPFK